MNLHRSLPKLALLQPAGCVDLKLFALVNASGSDVATIWREIVLTSEPLTEDKVDILGSKQLKYI